VQYLPGPAVCELKAVGAAVAGAGAAAAAEGVRAAAAHATLRDAAGVMRGQASTAEAGWRRLTLSNPR